MPDDLLDAVGNKPTVYKQALNSPIMLKDEKGVNRLWVILARRSLVDEGSWFMIIFLT